MTKKTLVATHRGELPIGDQVIKCFVLEDGRRMLSGRSATESLGLKGRGQGMGRLLAAKSLNPWITQNISLATALQQPVEFVVHGIGKPVLGIEAKFLPELCAASLDNA